MDQSDKPADAASPVDGFLGELKAEHIPGALVKVVAGGAAVLMGLFWCAVAVGGFWFVLRGEVGLFDAAVTTIPLTLVAGGFLYFGLRIARDRIQVFEKGLTYRSVASNRSWQFKELLDVRIDVQTYEDSRDQLVTREFLELKPLEHEKGVVRIRPFLGRNRRVLDVAVRCWQKSHSNRHQ